MSVQASNSVSTLYALGRMKLGERNKAESAYEQHLELLKRAGELSWYKFEGIKLRLADNCFYTPDFILMKPDGHIECHEVKSIWLGDAKVKIRMAAELYPFKFVAIYAKTKKEGGGWTVEGF